MEQQQQTTKSDQVRTHFNQLIESGMNQQQSIYWTARWSNLTEVQVKEIVMGTPSQLLNEDLALHD
jgi:hypothetical protein